MGIMGSRLDFKAVNKNCGSREINNEPSKFAD